MTNIPGTYTILDTLKSVTEEVSKLAFKQNHKLYTIISNLVMMQEKERLAKNYVISDRIREILQLAEVEIIQGTSLYEYKDIPIELQGKQFHDTWRYKNG